MDISNDLIENIIDKLIIDKYIDDERFSIAYIKDKYNFSSNGPYKIINELITKMIIV